MTARILSVLIALLCAAAAEAGTGAGWIEGQAVDARTGAPVRFATIALMGPYAETTLAPPETPELRNRIEITADEQGRFSFRDLAPGNYIVNARKDGYQQTLHGATRTVRSLVAVKAGERTSGVIVRMPPCGVIAGTVVNEKGEPMQGVEMVALRYSYGAWRWRPPVTPETPLKSYTNDLGEFRIANLTEGQYIVRAAARPATGRDRIAGIGYPSMFYPRALTPEGAVPVPVLSGETTPANFALQTGPAFRITGKIEGCGLDRAVCFGLVPASYNASVAQVIGRVSRFDSDGMFVIDDVPPGSYLLSAAACRNDPPRIAIEPVSAAGDVYGLRLELKPGRPVAGVVKGEGVDVSGLKLTLRAPDLNEVYLSTAVTAADGSFVFENVLRRRHIVEVAGMPAGAYIREVRYGGRPTPAKGFEAESDGALEIVLSAQGAAQLRGSVSDRQGKRAAYAMVMVLPADGGPPEAAKDVMADANGEFVFPALRPGTYRALAWDARLNPLGVETADPALPALFDRDARTVTLAAGGAGSVALTMNTMADVSRARAAAGMTPPKEVR